jgi:hypothetical protein
MCYAEESDKDTVWTKFNTNYKKKEVFGPMEGGLIGV